MTLPELRALLSRATPGPWQLDNLCIAVNYRGVIARGCTPREGGTFEAMPNVELIAAAINALPALLDAVEAAQRVIQSDRVVGAWPQEHAEAIAAFDAAVARLNGG